MRLLLHILIAAVLVGGAAFVRFLATETRAFEPDHEYRRPGRQNVDRGNPDPVTVIERRGGREIRRDPHPDERPSGDGSDSGSRGGTVYWVQDETGSYRMSTVPPPAPRRPAYDRPRDVDVVVRHDGPGTALPIKFLTISYRDYHPELVTFSAHADWTSAPLAQGESRSFGSKIPSGTVSFRIQWADVAGNHGFSRDDAQFQSGEAGGTVTWSLNATNCEGVTPSPIPTSSLGRTFLVTLIAVLAAAGVALIVRRARRANGTHEGRHAATSDERRSEKP